MYLTLLKKVALQNVHLNVLNAENKVAFKTAIRQSVEGVKKLLEFEPTKAPKNICPEWATYVPSRTTAPTFKVHKQRNHALAALTEHSILFHWNGSEWEEVYREDYDHNDIENCQNCGTYQELTKWGTRYWYHRWYKDTNFIGKSRKCVCSGCYHARPRGLT